MCYKWFIITENNTYNSESSVSEFVDSLTGAAVRTFRVNDDSVRFQFGSALKLLQRLIRYTINTK